ncbi:MAG: hypothetical protein M3R65_03725 [Gemmatimonadota bacterium]|nr:hypothetical protein [Gemmatimonadota bacterium]
MSGHGDAHLFTREEILAGISAPVARWLKLTCALFAIVGVVAFVVGAFLGVDRAWQAVHFNWLFFSTVSSAGVAIVAVQRITTARWSRPVVRFLEGYVAFLPVAFVILCLSLFFGRDHIFPWTQHPLMIEEKRQYLNIPFFITRDLVLFGIQTILSVWYIYTSVRLDVGVVPEAGASWAQGIRARMRNGYGDERRELHSTHSRQGRLAVFVVLAFALFWIVMSWDLSMSLDPHFQSTLYGYWFFMGGWVAAIASWTLITMAWRRHLARGDMITDVHFHDLGKLVFAFTAFWGYLTFGQYLVIWYGNLGEETHWARLRLIAPWSTVTMAVVVLMFVMPFFGLLSRAAKVYLPTMALFAACSVVGLYLHRYDEIYPSIYGVLPRGALPFGVWEVVITAGFLGVWGLCYLAFMDAFPRMRIVLQTSPYRDEVQVPVNPKTMDPLPAHE